jgi:hypothetical protein
MGQEGAWEFRTGVCPNWWPPKAYSRVDTGRNPSAVPSSSNFPASHLGSQLGVIAQSYRAFSSPPLGRPTRLPGQAAFCRRRHQPADYRPQDQAGQSSTGDGSGTTHGWPRELSSRPNSCGGGCHEDQPFSISVVCETCPARFATKVIEFARTVGVSSIRANSIRAMAIMTKAVETNRILDSPLSCCVTPPFPHELY